MGRRKKTDEELELIEPQASEEDADEAEETENADQAEASEEAEVEAEAEAEEEAPKKAPPKPRKPRQRRSRAKKNETTAVAAGLDGMAKAMEPVPAETKTPTVLVIEPTTASLAAAGVNGADSTQLRADAEVADLSIHKSMDSMVKQWASVKDISTSVCTNLDRVATVLQTLQTEHTSTVNELSKQGVAKMGLANRISVAVSAIAIVLSLISLSFSQAARQALFNKTNPEKAALAATAQPAVAPAKSESRSVVETPVAAVKPTNLKAPEKRPATGRVESPAIARASGKPASVKSGESRRKDSLSVNRRGERAHNKSIKK